MLKGATLPPVHTCPQRGRLGRKEGARPLKDGAQAGTGPGTAQTWSLLVLKHPPVPVRITRASLPQVRRHSYVEMKILPRE